MRKTLHILTAIIIISFFCSRCQKNSSSKVLPPITQTGANTFGCKINGQVWVPYYPCNDINMGGVELEYNIAPISLTSFLPIKFALKAGNFNQYKYGTSFFDIEPSSPGGPSTPTGIPLRYIYNTGNVADSLQISFSASTNLNLSIYTSGAGAIFQITKLDTINKIISGIFSFTLFSSPTDSIVVSDGRFDFKIGQYSHCSN